MALVTEGSMKLIFLTNKSNKQLETFQALVELCIKNLSIILGGMGLARVKFKDTVHVETKDEYYRVDCEVVISGPPPFYKYFSPVSRMIVKHVKEIGERYTGRFCQLGNSEFQFRIAVQIQDRVFFSIGDIVGADLQVKAQEVSFGNLIKHDSYLKHYAVDTNPENGWYGVPHMMHRYYGPEKKDILDNKTTIYVDFEHDRYFMNIIFPVLWTENRKNGGGKAPHVAKLKIDYSSIKRIFCDFDTNEINSLKLYIQLKGPPQIKLIRFFRKEKDGVVVPNGDLQAEQGQRYKHWMPYNNKGSIKDDIKKVAESPYIFIKFSEHELKNCLNVLGRLLAAVRKPIEIRQIIPKLTFTKHLSSPLADNRFTRQLVHNNKPDNEALYLFHALLSRGAHVKDQILVDLRQLDCFTNRFLEVYAEDRDLAIKSLTRLINVCDENNDMRPLYLMLNDAIEKTKQVLEVYEEESNKDGYVWLQKCTITPTRVIIDPPELIMGNRVLRSMPIRKFLRVSFRDDDFGRIQPTTGHYFIENFVKPYLLHGINIGDRTFLYLGSSNSQMREQGCYFMEATYEEIRNFRKTLGEFKLENVPKLMARFGQCFTQSMVLDTDLKSHRYTFVPDYVGGSNSKGNKYEFSDGVGCISKAFTLEIAKQLKFGGFIPSCIQGRFRGCKGVFALNPHMDQVNQWIERRGIEGTKVEILDANDPEVYRPLDVLFRPSQCKFETSEDNQRFEVVKLSGPSPVTLNRPLINILDQISAKQGYAGHKRMTNRIFQLLDQQLQTIAHTLTNERAAQEYLFRFPRLILFKELQLMNFTDEPFFRSMIHMAVRCTLNKLRNKLQIAVPGNLGRTMFGVIDETGLLNYGQVYIRYTMNVQDKKPSASAERKTLTGPVLVTRNPMIVGGDVRMLEAVDIPALEHFSDVIVFPRWGPRSHPDEMGGGDLDGDEYNVIWDPELFLLYNEPAFDYTAEEVVTTPSTERELYSAMANFFIQYIQFDSVGKLAHAHLFNSDMYGIDTSICTSIAKKHMQAVDFPKTGKIPDSLERFNPKTNSPRGAPPRHPDYKESNYKPSYISPRLTGSTFRRIEAVDNALQSSIDEELSSSPKMDNLFDVQGFDQEMDLALKSFNSYKAELEDLMNRFGVDSEIEIFSNSYTGIRKRLGDKHEEDFSSYNTQSVIKKEIKRIYSTHRKRLFEQHGKSFDDQVEWPYRKPKQFEKGINVILRSVCHNPSKSLQRLAVAYYKVAYGQNDQKFLSFAWLGADVLARVRQENVRQRHQQDSSLLDICAYDPLSKRISDHINEYISQNREDFYDFHERLFKNRQRNEAVYLIRAYCERHKGLTQLLYFTYKWALVNDLLFNEPTRTKEQIEILELDGLKPAYSRLTIILTFIQFGLDSFVGAQVNSKSFLEETEVHQIQQNINVPSINPNLVSEINLIEQHGGIGKKFLQFLEFTSSLEFARMKRHTFMKFKVYTILAQQQHVHLHKTAVRTYYRLCLSNDFTVLPHIHAHIPDNGPSNKSPAVDGEGITFELPTEYCQRGITKEQIDLIKKKTRVDDLSFRVMRSKYSGITTSIHAIVTGSRESVTTLKNFLSPTGFINFEMNETALAKALSSQVQKRFESLQPSTSQVVSQQNTNNRY